MATPRSNASQEPPRSFPTIRPLPSTAFMTGLRSRVMVRNLKPAGSCFSCLSGFGRSTILVRRKLSEFQGIVQKKRLLKSEGRKAVRQTSPLYCAMLHRRWVGSGFFQTLVRLHRAFPASLMINPVQLLHVLFRGPIFSAPRQGGLPGWYS